MKKIAIGCDPNAEDLKAVVKQQLTDLGYEYEDYGSDDPIYANVAIKVAEQVSEAAADIAKREAVIISAAREPGFNMARLRKAWGDAAEIH